MPKVPLVFTPGGHPAINQGFLDELERFDRNVKLAFSEYKISKINGKPLISEATGRPIYHPRWTVWFFNEKEGRVVFMFEWERGGEYAEPDRGIIEKIRSDLIRQGYSSDWIADRMFENSEETKKQQRKRYDDLKEDFFKENEKLLTDAVDGVLEKGKLFKGEKLFSYEGQSKRSSNSAPVKKSNKELGLIVPNWKEELKDK